MKKLTMMAALSIATLPTSYVNAADDLAGFEISSNVGFFSDYAFRGISQSDERPVLQGGFDVSHESGFYAGVWGSNVDFNDNDEATLEFDIYGGYSGSIDDISYDFGLIYYAYPGADASLNYDFYEVSAAVGYDFDVLSASASINYSPEYFGDSGDAVYYSGAVAVPLPNDFSLSGHVGYQTIDDGPSYGINEDQYTDWSLGLGYSLAGFDLSLQYIDTNLDEPTQCSDGCSERVIFGVSRSF